MAVHQTHSTQASHPGTKLSIANITLSTLATQYRNDKIANCTSTTELFSTMNNPDTTSISLSSSFNTCSRTTACCFSAFFTSKIETIPNRLVDSGPQKCPQNPTLSGSSLLYCSLSTPSRNPMTKRFSRICPSNHMKLTPYPILY